jgi:hypothetical protein
MWLWLNQSIGSCRLKKTQENMLQQQLKYQQNMVCAITGLTEVMGLAFLKQIHKNVAVMDRLQTSGELQDKTSFIDPSTGVDLLKGCSPDYLLL